MHKEIVVAQVKVGEGKYKKVKREIDFLDVGDKITVANIGSCNSGIRISAQNSMRNDYLTAKGLKTTTAKGKSIDPDAETI